MIKLMILFALACNVAFATETYKAKVGGYTYKYSLTSNNCAVISDGNAWAVAKSRADPPIAIFPIPRGRLELPSQIEGHDVVEIGDFAFSLCSNITEVIVPSGVSRIGKYAFAGCALIESIKLDDLPNCELDDYSFAGCRDLKCFVFPKSIARIGHGAFAGCKSLVCVDLPNTVKEIGSCAFYENNLLKKNKFAFRIVGSWC